jgi:molybdenum cofactor cytidylyltransferase
MTRMDSIMSVVLAAGESRRMGQPKMLLPFRGKTMIEHVIENIRKAGLESITVVIGAEKEKLPVLLQKLSVNFCVNNEYHQGMLSSVICGIRHLPENVSAILIFPGDQPLISPDTIAAVVKRRSPSDKGIIIPVYKKRRGHPVMIDIKYKPAILNLNQEEGLRSLAVSYPEDVCEIETDDPGILKDFDTYEEYLNELNQIS